VEGVHDVLGLDGRVCLGGNEQAGVIVDHVQDLGVLTVGELPVRDVGLPCLIREVCFEADQAAAGSLLWFWDDQASASEDPPDRCS
jgi:hypothetical protein